MKSAGGRVAASITLWLAATVFGADSLKVGSVNLAACGSHGGYCGTLNRPLDPSGAVPGSISVYFEFYPRTGTGKPAGTLVATEGGPGYPATDTRDEYLALFQPLRDTRDVVLMDNRGTGRSNAVDCQALQSAPKLTETNIGHCGDSLGAKAPLYSATLAADDLDAILQALGAGRIDLYGDSYGTFFEQVFAVRHPSRLRSVVLDGAYPLDGPDYAWYPNYAPAMREKFNLACERSEGCGRLLGTSMDHIAPALAKLRREPVAAKAYDADGNLRQFTADASQLAMVMFGSAPAYATVRETDAAARAYVAGDKLPLWRLMAETQVSVDSRDESRLPAKFSSGLAAAVTCEDAPQIFNMSLPPAQRVKERDRIVAERERVAPNTYGPFTFNEYRGMTLDYTFIDQCVRWPAVDPKRAAEKAKLRSSAYPDVPALVISGDLDNMTPAADGEMVAKRFPHGRHVLVPNGFHVNALPHSRSACGADIARHFIESLEVGDTSCLRSVPEVRVLPAFAQQVHDLEPARALSGNEAGRAQLQAVSGAILTVGDAIARIGANSSGRAVGLRGGAIDIDSDEAGGTRLTLHDVLWTSDLRVSGTVQYPGRSGQARADIEIAGLEGSNGSLAVQWSQGVAKASAHVQGVLGQKTVLAETAAP